jgi:hypothetical protein
MTNGNGKEKVVVAPVPQAPPGAVDYNLFIEGLMNQRNGAMNEAASMYAQKRAAEKALEEAQVRTAALQREVENLRIEITRLKEAANQANKSKPLDLVRVDGDPSRE